MAIELPYFRFEVQSWQNGDISLENYELQGLFISICGYYWTKDCSVTLAMLQKKYSNAREAILIDKLIELTILKHEKRHDKVEIVFLNRQFDLLSEKRKRRQDAGSKGGNATAMRQQKGSYKIRKDKIRKDKIRKDVCEVEIIFPFESQNFKSHWEIWKDYKKKQHGFIYKTAITEQGVLKELCELSEGLEAKAIQVIDQSITKGWKGLFTLKNTIQNGIDKKDRVEQFASYFKEKGREGANVS